MRSKFLVLEDSSSIRQLYLHSGSVKNNSIILLAIGNAWETDMTKGLTEKLDSQLGVDEDLYICVTWYNKLRVVKKFFIGKPMRLDHINSLRQACSVHNIVIRIYCTVQRSLEVPLSVYKLKGPKNSSLLLCKVTRERIPLLSKILLVNYQVNF